MFKNYLKTALRNFRHNKTFSLINVLGLAFGNSDNDRYFITHAGISNDKSGNGKPGEITANGMMEVLIFSG